MYNFMDTKDTQLAGVLPAEALSINGTYIENEITGYRTVNVSGRELTAAELFSADVGKADGAVYQGKRYQPREITVTYQLVSASNAAFRAAYNRLNQLLAIEQAKLIFADEPDKYFIGTLTDRTAVDAGRNSVVGEFTFTCVDPFKYSITEHEVTFVDGVAELEYFGTMPAYPVLIAEFYQSDEPDNNDGDCGYVAFLTRDKIIQIGDPDEIGEVLDPSITSETLINQAFNATPTTWTYGDGVTIGNGYEQEALAPAIQQFNYPYETINMMFWPIRYNTAPPPIAKGGSFVRALPADRNHVTGAADFKAAFNVLFAVKDPDECGGLQVVLSDASDNIVCSVDIYKTSTGTTGTISLSAGRMGVAYSGVDLSLNNSQFGQKSSASQKITRACTITKNGETVLFDIAGFKRTYIDNTIANTAVTKVTLGVYSVCGERIINYKGFLDFKFVKNNCAYWVDVPNKFGTNDVITADCRTGDIYMGSASGGEGVKTPQLGAFGNDWEDFVLLPGLNAVQASWSDWVSAQYAPTLKLKYREVYL